MNCIIVNTKLGLIEYSSIGEGIPILFVHGGHSNCKETLSHKGFDIKKYRLITPSRPGYGKTPLSNNKTPNKTADLIIALINYLEIERVIVYGISAGGLTAIEIASAYPDRVLKLILASAVTKKWIIMSSKIYKTATRIFNPKTENLTWGMVHFFSLISPKFIAKHFFPQFSSNNDFEITSHDMQEFIRAIKNYRSRNGFSNDINQDIKDEVINKISCPTLIIHSCYDTSVSIEHAEHAHKQIKGSQLAILKNQWGHLFWIGKDSDQSIKITENFITDYRQ
jgi:pimeloyl-ACP methyl ester carboxylesterase